MNENVYATPETRKLVNDVALATLAFVPDESGHISEELMSRLLASPDFYTTIAAEMYKVPVDRVTPSMRDEVKRRSFHVLYGSRISADPPHVPPEGPDSADPEEHKTGLYLREVLIHRTLGIEGRIIRLPRGEPGSKNRPQYVIDILPDAEGNPVPYGGPREGTQGELLRTWRRQLNSGVHAAHTAIERFEANLLSWPNTMRVTDGPSLPGFTGSKKHMRLIGVLSLLDVFVKHEARSALYDYVTLMEPASGRARVKITKPSGDEGVRVTITFADPEDREVIAEKHLPAIKAEFEHLNTLNRHPRKPTVVEREFLKTIYKRGYLW